MEILNLTKREHYNQVTNSGVICQYCKKPIGSVEYVKIFRVKNYPSPEDFEKW